MKKIRRKKNIRRSKRINKIIRKKRVYKRHKNYKLTYPYLKKLLGSLEVYDFSKGKVSKITKKIRLPRRLPRYFFPREGLFYHKRSLPKKLKGKGVVYFLLSRYELNTPRLLRKRGLKFNKKTLKKLKKVFQKTDYIIGHKLVSVNLKNVKNLNKNLRQIYEFLVKKKSFIKNREGLIRGTRNYGLDIFFPKVSGYGVLGFEFLG